MIIEVYLNEEVEPVGDSGTFYIDTSSNIFIEEINKYQCPIRLIDFLDEEFENNNEVTELIRLPENGKIDLFINLSNETQKIIDETDGFTEFDKYLENTSHLNKYGNQINIKDKN